VLHRWEPVGQDCCGSGVPVLFIAALPLILISFIVTEWKQSWYRVSRLFMSGLVAVIAFLLTHLISARSFLIALGEVPVRGAVFQVLISVFRKQLEYFNTVLPRVSWFMVIAFGTGFAFLVWFIIRRSLDNRRSWMLLIVKLLFSLLSVVIIFNLPFSVWALATSGGIIPVFSSMLAATAVALLAVSWKAQAVMDDPADELDTGSDSDGPDEPFVVNDKPPVFNILRVAGVFTAPLMLGLILLGGTMNLRAVLRDDGSFMDRAAEELINNLGDRRWLVANGLMDSHILIAAHEKNKKIVLLAPYRVRDRFYCNWLCRIIESDETFSEKERNWAVSLINYNLHMFINDFFVARDRICSEAACMGLPDIWYESGKVPVPELLFYGGADSVSSINGKKLLRQHNEFLETLPQFFEKGSDELSNLTRRYEAALRRHLAFVANNLGVVLDETGMSRQAFRVYDRVLALYPRNISALLNRFEMVSRGLYPEKRDLVEKQLNERVKNTEDRYPLWALNRHFGYVRNYELFVNMGWEWAVSSSPGSVIAGLRRTYAVEKDREKRRNLTAVMAAVYEMKGDAVRSRSYYEELIEDDPRNTAAISGLVRLSLNKGGVAEAREILERGIENGVPAGNLRKDWAALYLMSGDISQARVTLQAMADQPGADTMTIAMLAMVLIEQGEFAVVESKLLPRLIKMEKSPDNYFALVVEGRIYQMKGKKWYPKARKKFQRAFTVRSDVSVLRNIIFRLDVALEDRVAAEAHAIEILRGNPDHLLANFFMGSVALEEGEYGEAEEYLKRAAAAPEPTVEVLNNYAQLLCRIKRTAKAIQIARKATNLAPERYEVWSTLAYVLQDSGDLKGAVKALVKASSLNKTDKRLFIIDGLIAMKQGDVASVKRAVEAVAGEENALPVTSRRDLRKLKEWLN
ncbi:MAG: hypothetical protein R6V06_09630, partial [Kiritimatiellia bacterium]